MRISDWSSDVCSSDLRLTPLLPLLPHIPFTSFAGCVAGGRLVRLGLIREAKIMVKENPIHKQQIDPILMSERFPYYDLDGQLAACGAEIHQIIAGREDAVARAYWDTFNKQIGRASCRERGCTYR